MIFGSVCAICMSAGKIAPTTMEECNSLGFYHIKGPAAVHEKIAEYEAKLKSDSNDYYSELAIGILYGFLATPADKYEAGAARKDVDYTDKFLLVEKDNPLALIWNGLGHGLISRDETNVIVKLLELNTSFGICDKAVDLSAGKPYEWNIRFMRANMYVNLPAFFNKTDIAVKDYRFVEDEFNKNTGNRVIEGSMGTVYYYLGENEKSNTNMDKAVEYWKKSVLINDKYSADSYEAKMAKKELDTFSD